MSRTLKIKRRELGGIDPKTLAIGQGGYEDIFRQCGGVTRAEGEDRELFMKFRYAIGRNWKKIESEIEKANQALKFILNHSKGYIEFLEAHSKLADELAEKDEDGNVILESDKNDPSRQHRKFSPEAMEEGERRLAELKASHADAIKEQLQRIERANAFLDEEIEIELYSVPFAWVPEKISGPWFDAIMCMVDDPPAI